VTVYIRVRMARHINVREHSTWTAHIPVSMLDDPTYFSEDGEPTSAFDQWMCDTGDQTQIEYDTADKEELDYSDIEFGKPYFHGWDD